MSRPSWLSEPVPSVQPVMPPANAPESSAKTNSIPSSSPTAKGLKLGTSKTLTWIKSVQETLLLEMDEGNSASLAFSLLAEFETAIRDHEFHGANWFTKHREELLGHLRLTGLFPYLGTERQLEGQDLYKALCLEFKIGPYGRREMK